MPDSQEWKNQALCKDLPIEEVDRLLFVGRGQSGKRARLFCEQCPVRSDCLNYSLAYNEDGTWGGQTEEERSELDPFIVDLIKNREYETHGKEDRNLDHFIPKARQVTRQQIETVEQLTQSVDELLAALELDSEPSPESLEALAHQYEHSNGPLAS